jgi:hypothetical protein
MQFARTCDNEDVRARNQLIVDLCNHQKDNIGIAKKEYV